MFRKVGLCQTEPDRKKLRSTPVLDWRQQILIFRKNKFAFMRCQILKYIYLKGLNQFIWGK
jgi:hypothetical protein